MPTETMSPKMAAHRLRSAARAVKNAIEREERSVARRALARVRQLSSGTFKTSELSKERDNGNRAT